MPAGAVANPILFVTQVPSFGDFAARASTFGNHTTRTEDVVRGGDLMIRYPDGSLRNLTREAGFGKEGFQDGNGIAVREPSMHWGGTKAVFSMLVGSNTEQTEFAVFFWQMYEVSGLGQGQAAVITKVPNQPAGFNNVSPIYGTNGRILFTSDRPRNGATHLYPALDEYESAQSVTGIWSMNPAVPGDLHILNHTPSGAFSPSIDSFGRVVFIRWDHLQRDQQRDKGTLGAKNFASEQDGAAVVNVDTDPDSEVFPEPRLIVTNTPYGQVKGLRFNAFTPWQMNEDGTEEETLNHVGRHELNFGFVERSFLEDDALNDLTDPANHQNRKQVTTDGGLFHLREDPAAPGSYVAIMAKEFKSLTTNQIVRLTGAPNVNGDQMVVTNVTIGDLNTNGSPGGRYRNPLPLANGAMAATYTTAVSAESDNIDQVQFREMRLKLLSPGAGGLLVGAGAPFLTPGIAKNISWFDPNRFRTFTFSGPLWELEAVEVRARAVPNRPAVALEAPEASVFAERGVNQAAFKAWLVANNLALIISRNVTSRDDGDIQQPFNLRVPGGAVSTSVSRPGRVYDVSNLQIFQGDLVRGYGARGRRVIARHMHDVPAQSPNTPGSVLASVRIGLDGSMAAVVPARRALTWQLTDPAGVPIVRERLWLTMQPGEVRVCVSCHGANNKDQAGRTAIVNEPDALRKLLTDWKALPGNAFAGSRRGAAMTGTFPALRAQPARKP